MKKTMYFMCITLFSASLFAGGVNPKNQCANAAKAAAERFLGQDDFQSIDGILKVMPETNETGTLSLGCLQNEDCYQLLKMRYKITSVPNKPQIFCSIVKGSVEHIPASCDD